MSNIVLGTTYSRIMDEVIEHCQTTFEEEGVDGKTLEELRSTWQTKLTALHVGTFPWDPQPAPQPMANPATLPSNGPRPSGMPSNANPKTEPRIKTEPGLEPTIPTNLPANYGNNDASERAMANLSQKFGAQAAPQINRIQSQMIPNGHPYPPQSNLTPDQQRERQMEYQRRQAMAAHQQLHQAQHQQHPQHAQHPLQRSNPAVPAGHTDGNVDWNKFVNERRAQAAQTGQEADNTIRKHIEQIHRQAEGGGLMMPLSEQPDQPQAKRRKVDGEGGVPQTDGADGDDDEDEEEKDILKDELFDDGDDAINSDLDDPDDNEIEEEPEDGKPTQVMLCTYDKVQRVKNKWKCALRDGVLNTGGKDYVFGKATGEFEW